MAEDQFNWPHMVVLCQSEEAQILTHKWASNCISHWSQKTKETKMTLSTSITQTLAAHSIITTTSNSVPGQIWTTMVVSPNNWPHTVVSFQSEEPLTPTLKWMINFTNQSRLKTKKTLMMWNLTTTQTNNQTITPTEVHTSESNKI